MPLSNQPPIGRDVLETELREVERMISAAGVNTPTTRVLMETRHSLLNRIALSQSTTINNRIDEMIQEIDEMEDDDQEDGEENNDFPINIINPFQGTHLTTGGSGIQYITTSSQTSSAEDHFTRRQASRTRQDAEAARRSGNALTISRDQSVRNLNEANETLPLERRFVALCDMCFQGLTQAERGRSIEIDNQRVCSHCYSSHFRPCHECQSVVRRELMEETNNGSRLCGPCAAAATHCVECAVPMHSGDTRHQVPNSQPPTYYCYYCNPNHMPRRETYRDYASRTLKKFNSEDHGPIVKSSRIFSAEIECQYPDEDTLSEAMSKVAGEVGVTSDGSISGEGVELQTPKLSGKAGEGLIRETCSILLSSGFETDKTCGLHIHIDGDDAFIPKKTTNTGNFEGVAIRNLFLFYILFEDVIHTFLPTSRRANTYCKPIKNNYHIAEILNAGNLLELETIWYRATSPSYILNCKSDTKHGTRYCGVNFHTLLSDNHLEIRYHSGTISATKILEWVNLHTRIMDRIASEEITRSQLLEVQTIADLGEKTEKFFELVGLSESSKQYFYQRQAKFAKKSLLEEKELQVA